MKRRTHLIASLMLVVAACGGGDADTTTTVADTSSGGGGGTSETTTSTAAATTTTAVVDGGGGASGDAWCVDTADDVEFGSALNPSLDSDGMRDLMNQLVDRINEARSTAPSEIASDVGVVADAIAAFRDTLESFDYNFFALIAAADEDPSLLEPIESDELEMATDRIAAYCNLDIDAGGGGDNGGGVVAGGELPDGFPGELIPPDSTVIGGFENSGFFTADFTSTASYDDVVAFYTAELGPPSIDVAGETSWIDITADGQQTVIVFDEGPVRIAVVTFSV